MNIRSSFNRIKKLIDINGSLRTILVLFNFDEKVVGVNVEAGVMIITLKRRVPLPSTD